jgi:hypothetical protein
MKGGAEHVTTSCTLSFLSTKPIDIPIIIVSTQVVDLQIHVILKHVLLIIPQIGVGVDITMIDIVMNAFEVLRTPRIVPKNTLVIEKPKLEPSTMVEPIAV